MSLITLTCPCDLLGIVSSVCNCVNVDLVIVSPDVSVNALKDGTTLA